MIWYRVRYFLSRRVRVNCPHYRVCRSSRRLLQQYWWWEMLPSSSNSDNWRSLWWKLIQLAISRLTKTKRSCSRPSSSNSTKQCSQQLRNNRPIRRIIYKKNCVCTGWKTQSLLTEILPGDAVERLIFLNKPAELKTLCALLSFIWKPCDMCFIYIQFTIPNFINK